MLQGSESHQISSITKEEYYQKISIINPHEKLDQRPLSCSQKAKYSLPRFYILFIYMCVCPCKSSLRRVRHKVLCEHGGQQRASELQEFTGHLACYMDAGIPTLPLMIVQALLPKKPSLHHLALHFSSLQANVSSESQCDWTALLCCAPLTCATFAHESNPINIKMTSVAQTHGLEAEINSLKIVISFF